MISLRKTDRLPRNSYRLENGTLEFYIANNFPRMSDIKNIPDGEKEEERLLSIISGARNIEKGSIYSTYRNIRVSYTYSLKVVDNRIFNFNDVLDNLAYIRTIQPKSFEYELKKADVLPQCVISEQVYNKYQQLKSSVENNTDNIDFNADNFNPEIEISNSSADYQDNDESVLLSYDLQLKMENPENMKRVDFPKITQTYGAISHGKISIVNAIDNGNNSVRELGFGKFRVTVELDNKDHYLEKDRTRINIASGLKIQGKDKDVKALFLLAPGNRIDKNQNMIPLSKTWVNLETVIFSEVDVKGNVHIPELSKTDQNGRPAKGARFELWKKYDDGDIIFERELIPGAIADDDDVQDKTIKISIKGGNKSIPIRAALLLNGKIDTEESMRTGDSTEIMLPLKDTDRLEAKFSYPSNIVLTADDIVFDYDNNEFILTLPDNLDILPETATEQDENLNGSGNMDDNNYSDDNDYTDDNNDDDYTDNADDNDTEDIADDEDAQVLDDTSDEQTEDEEQDNESIVTSSAVSMLHSASAITGNIRFASILSQSIPAIGLLAYEDEDDDAEYDKIAELTSEDNGAIALDKLKLEDGSYYLVEISGPTSIPGGAKNGDYWDDIDTSIKYKFEIKNGIFIPKNDNIIEIWRKDDGTIIAKRNKTDIVGNDYKKLGYRIENKLIEVPEIPPSTPPNNPYIPPIIPDRPPEVTNNPTPPTPYTPDSPTPPTPDVPDEPVTLTPPPIPDILVDDLPTPLTAKEEEDFEPDDDIPLSGLPKTGEKSGSMLMLSLAGAALGGLLLTRRKKKTT